MRRRFLHELGLSDEEAFLDYNLAPLRLRRDIAVLGLLHRIQLGEAHQDFSTMFEPDLHPRAAQTRHNMRRHAQQFREVWGKTDYFNRSVFAAVRVYNVLPEDIVDAKTVQRLQTLLTKRARDACQSGKASWERMYSVH